MSGFKIKTEDAAERKELKGRVPAPVAAWFEEQAKQTGVPVVDVVGQALIYAHKSATRKPRTPRETKKK